MSPLQLDGEMTIYRAAELKDVVLGHVAAHQSPVFDLSQVGEIDTSGLQLLLLARNEAERAGKTFGITACSQVVADLINFFNFSGLLPAASAGQPVPGTA